MRELSMGVLSEHDKTPFRLDPKQLMRHMFITGQSGCGKSSLVGRLVEEMLLSDAGHVLFLDCNLEFRYFDQINEMAFGEKYNRNCCDEDTLQAFTQAWQRLASDFQIVDASAIEIVYRYVPADLKPLLLGLSRDQHPGACWVIHAIDETEALENRLTKECELSCLARDLVRWQEGRATRDEHQQMEAFLAGVRERLTATDLTRLLNAISEFDNQPYINLKPEAKNPVLVDANLVADLIDKTKFLSIDLLNFKHRHRSVRQFVVLHLLLMLWEEARKRFCREKADGTRPHAPLYIVIDEAHNLAPREPDSLRTPVSHELSSIIRTIAAEGRKFGLFLILVSQRPNKIDVNVLSECDNYVVMRSTPPTIQMLTDTMPIRKDDSTVETLARAIDFDKGEALYCGAFSHYELVSVNGSIKRTK